MLCGQTSRDHNMKSIKSIISETKHKDRPKNLSREFQVYGVYLAESLEDTKHYSLYIKLAKENNQDRLMRLAKEVAEKKNIKNKGAYFMSLLKKK